MRDLHIIHDVRHAFSHSCNTSVIPLNGSGSTLLGSPEFGGQTGNSVSMLNSLKPFAARQEHRIFAKE